MEKEKDVILENQENEETIVPESEEERPANIREVDLTRR